MLKGKKANNAAAATSSRNGGVADYFTIVGVGDQLVWQHQRKKNLYDADDDNNNNNQGDDDDAFDGDQSNGDSQKQQQQQQQTNPHKQGDDDAIIGGGCCSGNDEEEEEEKLAATERFHREIIEVSILTAANSSFCAAAAAAAGIIGSSSSNKNKNNTTTSSSTDDDLPLEASATSESHGSSTNPHSEEGNVLEGSSFQTEESSTTNDYFPTGQREDQPLVGGGEGDAADIIDHMVVDARSRRQLMHEAVPQSPSRSETTATTAFTGGNCDVYPNNGSRFQQATTTTGGDSVPAIGLHPRQQKKAAADVLVHAPYSGFSVVKETLPAGKGGRVALESAAAVSGNSREDDIPISSRGTAAARGRRPPTSVSLWERFQSWDANLDWNHGVRAQLRDSLHKHEQEKAGRSGYHQRSESAHLRGLRNKMENKLRQWHNQVRNIDEDDDDSTNDSVPKFYLAYKRRRHQETAQQKPRKEQDNDDVPAVAEVQLHFVRIHRSTLPGEKKSQFNVNETSKPFEAMSTTQHHFPSGLAGQLVGRYQSQAKYPCLDNDLIEQSSDQGFNSDHTKLVSVESFINIPEGFDEWSIPEEYQWIKDPQKVSYPQLKSSEENGKYHGDDKTVLLSHNSHHYNDKNASYMSENSSSGVEAMEETMTGGIKASKTDPTVLLPRLVSWSSRNGGIDNQEDSFCYIPVLAVRRQRLGDEERFHEDPAIVEMAVTFCDMEGYPVFPEEDQEDDEGEGEGTFRILGKSSWTASSADQRTKSPQNPDSTYRRRLFGLPQILVKRNLGFGFADAAFATKVRSRFPLKNYKDLPLPQEELPMFCYPTGCRLHRARLSDAPLPQSYGFVVKNERGDSIYVSCVSFMEPLTSSKINQLVRMSEKRQHTSLPHRRFCERRRKHKRYGNKNSLCFTDTDASSESDSSTDVGSSFFLTSFDEMTTFENKTICLVSRFPYWTAFRRFLSNLHILSESSSELPLERFVSHLLLSVPLPNPGGVSVLVPLPALNDPMILSLPPEKDFPLVDLPYSRLMACLDIKRIVLIVLGLLVLEKKVIVLSTRPSLVLDVCELLRSLLFPFELCAPYVPRLTEPFKTSLEFPGAIFVGIHDDGSPHGLAAVVREDLPEDGIIVDLDTGEIDCDGGPKVISTIWETIPSSARSVLISELEALCGDAGIVDGQEPLDSQCDSAFDVSLPSAVDKCELGCFRPRKLLDDRAVRDAFLRFFCAVLGGYERYLVVPDADFLISGNEWFDSQGFLASAPSGRTPYLTALVSTQLFQSFIQRRTEASDVHCLLFDECITEFHSSPMPYGRLGGDVEAITTADNSESEYMYSLLVDQSAAFSIGQDQSMVTMNKSVDGSDTGSSVNINSQNSSKASLNLVDIPNSESVVNASGDLVTAPSRQGLPLGMKYIYCIDGNPCFPHRLKPTLFLPPEPESWLVETSKAPNPLLARSERELEEADRRRRMATSYRGLQNNRRCLWQLPKLMGSHFLGSFLLCIPAQVSQPHIAHDQQSRYLLRALGALRLLRGRQRIVPDEAAYRALMVACGRTGSDRRVELVKLFGLLRSDGIFPSAVTLGQYTRALAEGYSKRLTGNLEEEDQSGVEVTEHGSGVGIGLNQRTSEFGSSLIALEGTAVDLEMHGRRWRNRQSADRPAGGQRRERSRGNDDNRKKRKNRQWLPVVFSSSFLPSMVEIPDFHDPRPQTVKLVAIWSRTRGCNNCTYVPLEEEIQAGWDVVGGGNEVPGAVACPRCGSLIVPMLGFKEMSVEEALTINSSTDSASLGNNAASGSELPPQIRPFFDDDDDDACYVAYISPMSLRSKLEQYVEEHGESILERDQLRVRDPEVFYNFWWYCCRFSLPLPLPIVHADAEKPTHYCAFAAWDRAVAERGCYSAAKVLLPLVASKELPPAASEFSFGDLAQSGAFDDYPLLSRFNLQGFYSTVWDHSDLSNVLVRLVEACDKRNFKPLIECLLRSNQRRRDEHGSVDNESVSDGKITANIAAGFDSITDDVSVELDIYRTILYLAKYQCTSAFHTFFPATLKPCKGYHFWCAMGTPLPIFDRLFREAVQRIRHNKDRAIVAPMEDVADVALGFRCVFGHLI